MKTLIWGMGIPAVAFALLFIVFYFTLGPEIVFDSSFWLPIVLFLSIFGLIVSVARLGSDRLFSKAEAEGDNWENIRVGGKWKYIFTLFARISSVIILSLTFGYIVTDRNAGESTTLTLTAFVLLAFVALAGSFVVSLELWKTKEYQFRNQAAKGSDEKWESLPEGIPESADRTAESTWIHAERRRGHQQDDTASPRAGPTTPAT